MKKVYIETMGCAANVRDSENIISELALCGFAPCNEPQNADLILINTCSVRERPEKKLFSEIGAFAKRRKNGAKIGVCGCTASALGEQILKRAKAVDFVLGARQTSRIREILNAGRVAWAEIDFDDSSYVFGRRDSSIDSIDSDSIESKYQEAAGEVPQKKQDSIESNPQKAQKFRELINISIGCDKKCSYCIVPLTRGKEISIPAQIIINQAQKAADSGICEILLLGQNVNSYGKRFSSEHQKINFAELLARLSEIKELKRIRFTSPHPLHMDDEFIKEFAQNKKVCKAIHMPAQSGSNRILKEMKRGYTKEWFLERVEKIRALAPQTTFGTDIIVGFPSENDNDFLDTLDLVKKVEFSTLYSFIYSPRPNTAAFELPQIESKIAQERLARLQNLHKEILNSQNAALLNTHHEVLFEEFKDGFLEGRTDTNKLVRVELSGDFSNFSNLDSIKSKNGIESSANLIGKIAQVKITKLSNSQLFGKIIESTTN